MAPRTIKLMGDSGESSFAPGTVNLDPLWSGPTSALVIQQGQSGTLAPFVTGIAPPFHFLLAPGSTILDPSISQADDGAFITSQVTPIGTYLGLIDRVTDSAGRFSDSPVFSLQITPSPPVWTGPPSPQQIFRGQPLDISGYVSATTAIASFSISPLSTVSEATLNAGGITLNHTGGFFSAAANATLVSYPNVIVLATLVGGGSAGSFAFSLNVLSQNGIVGTWFEDQSLTVPKGGTFDFTTWNIGEVPGPNLTYSLMAATLDCKTHAISAYSAALVPSYLSLNPATAVMSVSGSAPASANPYLLLKVGQSDGTTTLYTSSPISLCITEATAVTWQAWDGDKDAGGTRVNPGNPIDYTDPNQAFAVTPTGGYVYATSGLYTGPPLVPPSNKTLHVRCLTGPSGGRIVMDGGGRSVSLTGRPLVNHGQAANAPVNYTLDIRHVWPRHTKGNDNDYTSADPNSIRAAFDLVQTTDRTQNVTAEDCIFEDLGHSVFTSKNFGTLILHNNMFVNAAATGGGSNLHPVYVHGAVLDYRGNNNFWTYTYLDMPFVNGDSTRSQRRRCCIGQMVKTRMDISRVVGNRFNNERGSHSALIDFSNDGLNYGDGNTINEGPFSAILGAYGETFSDNKIFDFGSTDLQVSAVTNKLFIRLNTIWNRGAASEWFYRMIVRLTPTAGGTIVPSTGADPASMGSNAQVGVNTTTNNFTKNGVLTAALASGLPMQAGTPVRFLFSGGGSIAPLVYGKRYWCIPVVDGTNNHFAVADTKAQAIAGTKIDLTAAVAGRVDIELVPNTMDILDNVNVAPAFDSAGLELGYDDSDVSYVLNSKNSYVPASALADQNIDNANFALAVPVAAAALYADDTGATDYYSPT